MSGDRKLQERESYTAVHASERPDERERLDFVHEAMTVYFGNKLSLAPLETNPPKTILEMGAGSGAWTLHAAQTFPEAEILAVDLAEIPRALPPNVRFQLADLTKPFDFQPAQFDLVHARLLFVNLPNYKTVLDRTYHLVKPGGWLIIEDVDNGIYDELELGHGLSAACTAWTSVLKSWGIDNRCSREYESALKRSREFSEIEVHIVAVPVSGQTHDPALKLLGRCVRQSLSSIYSQAPGRLLDPRLTQEMVDEAVKELNDESRKLRLDFYFLWAKKHV